MIFCVAAIEDECESRDFVQNKAAEKDAENREQRCRGIFTMHGHMNDEGWILFVVFLFVGRFDEKSGLKIQNETNVFKTHFHQRYRVHSWVFDFLKF